MNTTIKRLDGTTVALTVHKRGEHGYHATDHLRWIVVYPDGHEAREGDEFTTGLEPGTYEFATPLENVLNLEPRT